MPTPLANMVRKVATCRLILGLISLIAVYVDPTAPTFLPWLKLRGGEFTIDPYALAVLSAYLAYSLAVYWTAHRERPGPQRLVRLTPWCDLAFGGLIVIFTEGTSSPFWPLFVFAIIAAGIDGGFRRSLIITTAGVALYMSLVLIAWHGEVNVYIMRPVYLATVGYLTAYLGQQRLNLEATVHRLETWKERNRIARALHDGCVQTLGGINLTLETCRELLRRGHQPQAMTALGQLQTSINREHDELRTYVRELAEVETEPLKTASDGASTTRFVISADVAGSVLLVEQVLQILREAVANVKRHAQASAVSVSVRVADGGVLITIDDDGKGFADPGQIPWSITSLVTDAEGTVRVPQDGRRGAHLEIVLPVA